MHQSGELAGVLSPELEAEYRDYLVVQTPETLRRFQDYVAPSVPLVDRTALGRIFDHWQLREDPEGAAAYAHPTLILTGRQDSSVGYASQWELLEHYPRATFAVLDRAGHALLHEQIELTHALVAEWLSRVREHAAV